MIMYIAQYKSIKLYNPSGRNTLQSLSEYVALLKETTYVKPSQRLWYKAGFALRSDMGISLSIFFQPVFFLSLLFQRPCKQQWIPV